ncbi:pentapeptide repeat-containing protein [Mucilaginibacter aquaedulcis]|uniref:pentapeptide repeat-containing protein n=1 Tax=Mucilaginibacter aquaedulcis TaxID=1187081 RepID=UPI0025B4787D|nr:pentapeptide repeat-containing protein [Mucilaginibacter aquaedulcis]MDN3548200.1 pentapeptide repeat-containing protein [Mucilaginibacter aquaedulcis]
MTNSATNPPDTIAITESKKLLDVKRAILDGSTFEQMMMNNARFKDVCITNLSITDANLSDLEIEGAQLGGAYIHNIGMPPEGHPAYDPSAKQRSLKFENCDLQGSTIINCNLSNIKIDDCNVSGMIINGISVDELLKIHEQCR